MASSETLVMIEGREATFWEMNDKLPPARPNYPPPAKQDFPSAAPAFPPPR
jgi:hypothetical protein